MTSELRLSGVSLVPQTDSYIQINGQQLILILWIFPSGSETVDPEDQSQRLLEAEPSGFPDSRISTQFSSDDDYQQDLSKVTEETPNTRAVSATSLKDR